MIRRALWRLLLEEGGWSRIWYGLATAMVIAGGGLIYNQTQGDGTPPANDTANLWIDTNGGTCTRHSTPATYVDAEACGNGSAGGMNLAYAAASDSGGDVIRIKAGTYTDGVIDEDTGKTSSNDTVFKVATGETVNMDGANVRASHITFDGSDGTWNLGPSFVPAGAWSEPQDVTFAHVDLRTGMTGMNWGDNFTFTDVQMGGQCNPGPTGQADAFDLNANEGGKHSSNITIEDSRIGDMCQYNDGSGIAHSDCASFTGTDHIIFRRNRVWYCGVQGFYTADGSSDVLVENNFFGPNVRAGEDDAGRAVAIDNTAGPITVRYNSFSTSGGTHMGIQNSTGTILVYGNAGQLANSCLQGTFSHNVWTGITCGATDTQADPGFVNNSSTPADLHLSANNSPACGAGQSGSEPTDFPATDIDGDTRSSPPDAGADERPTCSP